MTEKSVWSEMSLADRRARIAACAQNDRNVPKEAPPPRQDFTVKVKSDNPKISVETDLDRAIAIFGPLSDLLSTTSTKYNGVVHPSNTTGRKGNNLEKSTNLSDKCDCTFEFCDVSNDVHDDNCRLWLNTSFYDGDYKWDSVISRLVINFKNGENMRTTPWDAPEDYIWDGDTPVVSTVTALERATAGDVVEDLCDLEQEAFDAFLKSGDDEYGWVRLDDGSWADTECRVTYRITKDDKGQDIWEEEKWDENKPEPFCDCEIKKQYYCGVHGVSRNKPTDAWEWAADRGSYGNYTYEKCGHAFDRFILPNVDEHPNVDIRISGSRRHTPGTTPDFGVYAASCWNPSTAAAFIPWQDYGLPTCGYATVVRTLTDAWKRALDGDVVEFGCMGGHGRTGTMLACIAVLADPGLDPIDAVSHVRKVHCTKAIESDEQEWFVEWFAAKVRNQPFNRKQPASSWAAAAYDLDDWGTGTGPTTTTTGEDKIVQTELSNSMEINRYASGKVVTTYADGRVTTVYPKGGSTTRYGVTPAPLASPPGAGTSTNLSLPNGGTLVLKNKGNVAPGATANARRQAAKRANRANANKRRKQQRNTAYVQNRSSR